MSSYILATGTSVPPHSMSQGFSLKNVSRPRVFSRRVKVVWRKSCLKEPMSTTALRLSLINLPINGA